eukprot:6137810-Pleurochrysis_carterae.AAC.2
MRGDNWGGSFVPRELDACTRNAGCDDVKRGCNAALEAGAQAACQGMRCHLQMVDSSHARSPQDVGCSGGGNGNSDGVTVAVAAVAAVAALGGQWRWWQNRQW